MDSSTKATTQATSEKKKLTQIKSFSLDASLPEQGSWHRNRRKQILARHPEIAQLYGANPWSFLILIVATVIQIAIGILQAEASWGTILLSSATIGAYLTWIALMLGHEGSHGLVFKNSALLNKIHVTIAFLPTFLGPMGAFWAIEHKNHHNVIVDKMNRYGPQSNPIIKKIFGALFFVYIVNAVFFVSSVLTGITGVSHFLLYQLGMRKTPFPDKFKLKPYDNFPQVPQSSWFYINLFASLLFIGVIVGFWGIKPLAYLLISNGFCNGLHPLGMRQVQEHYIQRRGQPTNSVYSPMSLPLLNIGFHVEHHDFPSVPWSRLPKIRELAPEYYNNLFYYTSYMQIFWEFFANKGIPYTILLEDLNDFSY